MRRNLLLCAALVLAVSGCQRRITPGPFHLDDVGGYIRRLARANTPESEKLRRQIADGHAALARERESARHDGIPVSPEELNGPPVPAPENAALVYARLRDVLQRNPISRDADRVAMPMIGTRDCAPSEIAEAWREMRAHRDALALVHEAARRSRCSFQRSWPRDIDASFTDISRIRLASRLLQSETYLLAHAGRYRDAIAAAEDGFRLADHAASEPTLLGYLAGAAIQTEMLASLQSILFRTGGADGTADQIRRAVAGRGPGPSLARAMKGESAITVDCAFRSLRSLDRRPLEETLSSTEGRQAAVSVAASASPSKAERPRPFTAEERRFLGCLVDAAEADILRDMHRLVLASDRPWPERIAIFQMSENDQSQDDTPLALFRQSLLPSNRPACSIALVVDARANALEAAASVLAFRARTGRLPGRLEEAMDRPPADPFASGPLHYRREANGFVVYSVGDQGDFDGRGTYPRAACCRFVAPAGSRQRLDRLAALLPPPVR